MKTNKIKNILIILIVIFIAGCGFKYEVKTVVYDDGSCQRTLLVTYGDSIDKFYEGNYPIPIDTTWNLVIESDTNENGDTLFIHKASKFFESIEQMNQLYVIDSTENGVLERSVLLNKRFRWFYTFFDYQETYPKLFDQPSLKTYLDSTYYNYAMLSDDEQEKYLEEHFDSIQAKQFDDDAEKGQNKWLEFTIVNSCLEAVVNSSKNIETWTVNEIEFLNKKDSIIKLINGDLDLFDDDDIFDAVKRIFKIDSSLFRNLEKEDDFTKFTAKYNFWENNFLSDDYINFVVMPGLIIETNSSIISDSNEAQWNVDWMKYFTEDYEMTVTSRIVNYWAFWVSGIFIIAFTILIMYKRLIKKDINK